MGRLGQTGLMGHLGRWAAVAAVAAGTLLCGARVAEAETVYWRPDPSNGNWWNDPYPWCTTSGGGGTYYTRPDDGDTYRDIHIGNNAQTTMTLNGRWFLVNYLEFESGASTARTLNKSGNTGINVKYGIKNLSTANHVFAAPVSIDNNQNIWATSGNLTFNEPVYLKNHLQLNGPGTVTLTNLVSEVNLKHLTNTTTAVLCGGSSTVNRFTFINNSTVIFSNSAGSVTLTNMIVTNSANKTIVMRTPTRVRRVKFNSGTVVDMAVLSQNSAAYLGVFNPSATAANNGDNTMSLHYGSVDWTLNLHLPSTFDFSQDANFIVFEGRNSASSMSGESPTTFNVYDSAGNDVKSTGTWVTEEKYNSVQATSSTSKSAIWVKYTAPASAPTVSSPTASVTGTTTATLGATVDANHGLSISDYGIVYSSTASTPTVGGSGCTKAQKGTSTPTSGAAWTVNVTGLAAGTTYYYRGYATSSAGTGYSTVGTFTTLANQTTAVTVTQLTHTYAGNTITLVGSGGSGTGTPVYTFSALKSGGSGTGSLTSAGVLTVTKAGTFKFDVTRAASGTYGARTDEVTITVNPGTQTISGLSNISKTYGDANFNLSASAVGTVTYTSSASGVATISGSTVTITGAGTATITANAAATDLYKAATATATLTVNKAAQTLTLSPTSLTIYVNGATATITPTAGYGSPSFTFTSSATGKATVSSAGVVTAVATGTATITVTAGETANYGSATATCSVKVHAAVPSAPTGMGVTARAANSLTVGWTRGTGGTASMGVASLSSTFTAPNDSAPSSGSGSYTANATYGSGTALGSGYVVYLSTGGSPSVPVAGLTPATRYYFAAYSRNGGSGLYAFSSAATADAWTLATEPTGQAGSLTAGTVGSRKASLTWTAGAYTAASGESSTLKTLLIAVPSGSSVTAPTDGETYSAGATLGAGTVVFAGTGTSAEATGLTPEQTYTIYAYAYTEGGDTSTANYLTTSPATRSITTTASQGPNVQATGVTATGYLLNWSQLASDSSGYDVQTRASGGSWADGGTLLRNSFTSAEGWTSQSYTTTTTFNANDGTWAFKGSSTDYPVKIQPSNTSVDGDTGNVVLAVGGTDYLMTPPVSGSVTSVRVKWRAFTGGARTLKLYTETGETYGTETLRTTWSASAGEDREDVYTFPTALTGGVRFKLMGGGGSLWVGEIEVCSSMPGYSQQVTGLTSGSTYEARVRKNPDGDWSDELSVKAGVVPNTPTASAVRNAVTFTWTDAQSGAVGYMVDATTTDQGWTDQTCPTGANSLSTSFGTAKWKYIGGTANAASGSSTSVKTAPQYVTASANQGHFLVGKAGLGIESEPFAIAGATGLKLSFRVLAWNLASASAKLEAGRINAYYKLDDGPWCFLGTGTPATTSDNSYNDCVFPVPAGALDGDEIAFKIVAVNGEGDASNFLRGSYIQALKVQSTSLGAGYYGANSLSGYPRLATSAEASAKSVKVSGLTAGQSVGFRVQALQGSTANPTAYSVWVEATGTTTAYTAPGTPVLSDVTRNGMTATWTAGDTTDLDHYEVQWSTVSSFSTTAGSANVAPGTLTKAISGLTASTTYYVRVRAVGTDSQYSAWSGTANATTTGFSGPATVTASGETRNGMTLAWDAVSGAASYNVEWTTCGVDSSTAEQEGETCPSSTRAYDTHSATDWTYRKGYSASAGYSAGAYPYWHGTAYGHWLAGQYVNTTYKPGVETPALDLSDAKSGYIEFAHRKANDGTNTLASFSPVTLYYSLDGGAGWTNVSSSTAGTGSWVTKTIALPSVVLGRKNVRLQLRADKAAAYYDTSASAYKVTGAGIKDIKVYKYRTGGNYECAATQSRNVSGTTTALTGLNAETLYYFRVQAVGSGDGATSTWTAGSSSTTAFLGPDAEVTGSTRYTLTAGWEAYTESGYTTSYDVQLTGCANAGAEAETVGSCPAQNLDWGTSAGAWTYQREYSGTTASSYPKYGDGVHKLWGQYSSTTVQPAILSPELDLAGYVAASVEFTHAYVNRSQQSEVVLYYSLDEGTSWTKVAETGVAAGYTVATGSSRSIPLPGEALAGGVKLKLETKNATNYDSDGTYMAQGASIANLKVVARGAGGGDYTCEDASAVYNTDSTSYTFTGLEAGKSYYVQVRTVLTPSSGPVEMSSWSETSGQTAEPQSPPEEVWAEGIRQNHMTVAWEEADGATSATLYELQVTGCEAGTSTETAVQPSSTEADLGEGDDWSYIGGGTEVTSSQKTDGHITGRGTYPAYAGGSEKSQVLAGEGEPGLESAEFSTMGATAATLTFNHGRWYNKSALASAAITPSYSTDGGESWTELAEVSGSDMSGDSDQYATHARTVSLPAAALGHAHVKVRLVAKAATVSSEVPVGAAIRSAKVTLTKGQGNYESCASYLRTFSGLTAETLSQTLEGLAAGQPYYFRVRASDGLTTPAQYGAWVEGTAATVAAPAVPGTPWAVDVGRHAMTIRWQPVEGAETYTVVVYKNGTEVKTQSGVANTEWMVTGLDGSTTYTFKVSAQADGESSALSAEGTATTTAKLRVTGLRAEDILDTSMTLKWDQVSGVTYTLHWGEASAEGTVTLNQEVACPASSLKRSDAGNKWFYFGGNGSWPAYWTSTSDPANDHGHALIYNAAGQPGIQSRWFSTFDASAAYVEFLHGRFNSGADSTVLVEYSIDGGATWATAGTAESTTAATPTEARSIPLPEAALGRRSVMVRLTATGASGNKGAHVKDLQVRVVTSEANAGSYTTVNNSQLGSSGSYALSGLTSGKRYWFEMFANEGGSTAADDNAKAETTAATRTKTTGAVKSQGFEGPSGNGALDTVAWGYTVKWIPVQNGAAAAHTTRQSGDPEVAVVADENPLYGDRALRMSGSASAGVYGVVEFADYNPGGANSWVVTIPFAVRDLASGENLWVTYSTDGGSTWVAPAGLATLTKSGMTMGKIARGGDDTMNQNWPYNKGLNSTTRPGGDAYSFEVEGAARIMVRVAFCGNSGSAAHYVYIDGVTLTRKPGMPTPVSATAQDSGGVLLEWTAPEGQGVVILRGQDERHVPASPVDVENIPHGYEIVMNGDSPYWPNDVGSFTDMAVQSGWTYYYYFYGAVAEGGTYTLGTTPNTASALVKGMVQAIASQGWDDFDIHPWGYRLGRVTNPGRSSDYGFWKENGMNATTVAFIENSYETDSTHPTTVGPAGETYAKYYGTGDGAGDADKAKQLGVSSQTNYYGGHSFRLSGGGSATYSGTHVWTDYDGSVKTNTAPAINTNNAAIEFANVDLSGYKNVEFTMHFAGMNLNGGNDLHVAVSTNGGAAGSWLEVANNNEAGWRVYESHYDYGRAISDGDTRLGGDWNFYFEDSARATPYGNPYVLQVPDTVTQFMVRVMFYDSNGGSRRNASYFIDEVRLTGEVAIEAPHPVLTDISKTELTASWEAVPDATGYNVKLTACEKSGAVQLQEGFVLSVLDNGWTGEGAYALTSAANRRGSGYGLSLDAKDEAAISPMVGAASSVSFWLSSSSANSGAKMEVQARAEGETTWVTVAEFTAPGTTWAQKTVQLPRRQWQQVRFVKTVSPSTVAFRIDDVVISGGGEYESCSTKLVSATTTATNYTFTGLSEGTEYFVEVQAYGSPAGYLAYSAWAETADYTPGTFAVAADGFEMTRSTWGASASVPILVMAVNEGKAFSEATVPTGDPAVGTAFGEGVVIAKGTSEQAAPGFEHVVPYGSRTEPVEAKYVAFWKHGSYWEGRLETNVVLGTYVAAAADAMAVTNGTAVTAGTQGKGWDGSWQAWEDGASYVSVIEGSLVGSNKLAGAGGNMVRFTMEDTSRYLRLYRPLATAMSSGEVWIMATFRSRYGMDPSNPNESKTLAVQLSDAKDNPAGGVYAGDSTHVFAQFGRLADTDRHMKIWDSSGNTASSYTLDDWGHGSGSGIYTMVAKYTRGDGNLRVKVYYDGGTGTISGGDGQLRPTATEPQNSAFDAVRNVGTHNVASIFLMASGYHGYADFDEIRVGESWQDIVGKETEAPFPVTGATAWTDGNELVRISWTYADEGTDNSVTPAVERPLADGVRILAREGTSGEWTEIYKGKGTNEAAVAAGGISRWDHVVAPGSLHQYQVVAYASGKSAAAVDAVLKDSSPATYNVETGLYGETEYVNPFAYTNWSTAPATWVGGNGFGTHAWSVPGTSAGTWSIATPEEAQAAVHITNAVTGSRMAAGNVLKVVVGDGETASMSRQLAGDAWCGKGGETFYVAFRMAYQWGDNGGREVGLRLTDAGGKYVQFGKGRGDNEGWKHRFGVTASLDGTDYSTGWSTGGDDMAGYGNAGANSAFLVVGKVNWSADGKANLRAVHYGIGTNGTPASLPGDEADVTWEARWDNAGIAAIQQIELIAGTENAGYGTIGTAWFDEIRFGTKWEDIVGATEPEDVWVDGVSETAYLGDFARWYMYGWPKGPKQSAWVSLAANTSFSPVLATSDTDWVDNINDPNRAGQYTKWQGREIQFTQTGTLYGGGSVKGELVTANSWTRTAADDNKWNTYSVQALPAPTAGAVGGTAKVTLTWTPATVGTRTFGEVMVVRYTGASAPEPVQGTTYMKGQAIGTGTVVYRGTAQTTFVDKGLTKDTTYQYALYTVNNSYYSTPAAVSAKTDENDPPIEIDGDPSEWVGVPSDVKNSSTVSSGEWIWTDKVLDGRVDKPGAYDADITEFRMKVDGNRYVNFMARLHCLTNRQNPYIAVGIVTNVDATQLAATGNEDGENWIGDESATFMGGNLFEPASLHYADIQMAVHWVTTAGENGVATGSGGWVVELYRKDGNSWSAPVQAWEAASSANLAEDPCIEWKVKRSDLGLDYPNVTPARFTVASFVNGGGWNNDTEATVDLSSGTSHAVDTLCIAPWGVNDKDLALTAWDEGIKNKNAEYWFDIWFGPTALHNAAPNAPASYTLDGNTAYNGQLVTASPTMAWSACTDHDDIGGTHGDLGFVVGYLVEVSTDEYFNGLEGTTENGPISCRVNLKGADATSYRFKTDSRYYWWRVRARDNSGALSAPTPWHYEVTGKTDNEGPEPRLLFVGKDDEVGRYVTDAAFRHEMDMSGDATSVLDSDLEDGGHTFGFVIEWYDVNGVFATNWYRGWKTGDPEWPKGTGKNPYDPAAYYNPSIGDFAWNILAEHGDGDGTPYGRVSPNWDLIIVDRSTVGKDAPTVAGETVNGVAHAYEKRTDLVLPTDDGGTETLEKVWIIDCGLDRVFQPAETINTGNDGQYVTNHVQGAFAIGTYRTDLDIYLTVSAEDDCRSGPYAETADYDWPLYNATGDTGSYKGQSNPSGTLSGWCAAAPNPSRNVTTNQLLHIHVRDNDDTPPVTSQAKWRADATGEGGTVLLPMMAVTSGGDASAPANWDPTWANLGAQGRVPTQEGQGKALQWQLTDGDVATYTHPATAGGSGTTAWKGSAAPIHLFFNVYDEYLHSGLASFKTYDAGTPWNASTWTAQDGMEGAYTSVADNQRTLRNTGLVMPGTAGEPTTNWTGYAAAWSKITAYEWTEAGNNEHGLGTGPDSVLAWQLDASQANLEGLLGQDDLLSNARIGIVNGEQQIVANAVRLHAIDNDNNAVGDQEGADLEFGQLIFTDDDATPPEMVGFTSAGTGTNYTHFGELGKWTWGSGYEDVTMTPLMGAIVMGGNVAGKLSSSSSTPESDSSVTPQWHAGKSAIYLQGNMNADTYRATNARYFEFKLGGNGNTVWRADMIAFYNRVSPTGPTKFALTMQGSAGIAYPAVDTSGGTPAIDSFWSVRNDATATIKIDDPTVAGYSRVVRFEPTAGGANSSAELTSGGVQYAGISTLVVDYTVGRFANAVNASKTTYLYVDYGTSDTADGTITWNATPLRTYCHNGTWTSTLGTAEANHTTESIDLLAGLTTAEKAQLANKWFHVRFRAVALGGTSGSTKCGFGVVDPKLTAGASSSTERLLGTMEVEKMIAASDSAGGSGDAAETAGSYANTETDVILGFDGRVEGYDDSLVTFRLYGYGATHLNANTGEIDTSNTANGTWAIKNLYIHGTASEPKKDEVTDYDVATGAWTNRLETLDGAMAGYDTVRSGLRVKDAAGEVSGEKPSFRILYPSAYKGAAPNGDPDGVVTTGDLVMKSVSDATFDTIADPDFAAGTGWTLANEAAIANGRLTLPGNGAVSSASRELALTSMAGVQSSTIAGTVRVRGSLTAENGGVNTLTVVAQPYAGNATLGDPLVTNITANAAWKNYAVGPWAIPADTVTKVAFTVKQTGTDSTELLVDELRMHVAQWGADIHAEDAAWATSVTNGMPAAKAVVGTPELDLREVSVPLSVKSGSSMPQHQWYTLEATMHDFDSDRPGDALSASATTNFWLYDDDEVAPQYGSKYGGPLGVFLNGTIVPQAWRTGGTENKLNQQWPITDAELTALAPADPVTFALSFYDYSGWYAKSLSLGGDAIVASRAIPAAAATRGWSAPEDNDGEAEAPGATSTWNIGAKNLYTAYKTAFEGTEGTVAEMTAEVWDKDNDRADDDLSFDNRVGYVWFTDSDIQAPQWGSQAEPYYGVMLSTNVPHSAEGYAAMLAQTAEDAPYAVGGLANNQGEFAGRSYTVYDGQLNALNASGNDKSFVVTANLNDPLPGFRARKVSGLQRGATLTEKRAMWGDDPNSPSDAANVFTITNTYVVLTNAAAGTAVTNAAFDGTFSEPVSKTRVAMQAGHTSWTWSAFPTNDIGLLLPPGAASASVGLWIEAFDSDMNRHNDQMHASLAGPTITLRDDDTQAPSAPSAVKVNGEAVVAGSITRETAPWTNDLSQIQVSWTAATDPEPTGYDIKKAGIAGYRLASHDATIDPDAGSALAGTTTNGTTVSKALSGVTMEQGWDTYKLFAVDADADRPGDALAGTAADVPLAYDITLPTAVAPNGSAIGSGNRLVADPDNTDDPTTQFDLTWPIDGIGPDDPSDTDHYNAIPAKYKAAGVKVSDQEILSPWQTYKVYYQTFEESAVPSTDNPNSQENSWVYQQHILTKAYKTWPSVVATSTATDPTAAANPYDSLKAVTANAGSGKQTVRLYDLDFDQHYMVVVVGVDKAGNEGPAGMWSWATNNTIKFAVTQGVVKASSAINTAVGALVSGTTTNTVGLSRIEGDGAPKKAAVLYWMAAGMKDGVGKVSKYYDLIYRDASGFSENGTEQWNMASTADNSGTSKTNWNYQADAGLSTPGRLRFYRASYTGRWQDTKPGTSEKQYPLASEEVYSMNNVVLSEGFNYVSLQGVPWTNTFRGVFGTDTDMWPGGSDSTDTNGAAVIEFYTPGSRGNIAVEWYFFGADGKWHNSTGTDVTDTLQADGFFARPFSINLPALATNEEGEVTGWWAEHDDSAVTARYNSRRLKGMMWHPILQVPTNAPTADGYTQTISGAAGTYNTLSLNLPVAVHPSQLGLGGIKKSNQPWLADKLYVVDTATKEVRGNTTMYCDANGVWRYNSNRAEVTGTPIKPNDMIVLISYGGDDWTWTYRPADFYALPTRHMGRTLPSGAGN